MVNKLVIENLKHRPLRTLLTAFTIGMQVMMILTLVGISRGLLADSERRARGAGADIWVKPPGTSAIQFSAGGLSAGMVPFLRKQPHVAQATGMLIQPIGGVNTVTGVALDEFDRMSGGFRYLKGGPFQGPGEVIVDEFYAEQNKKTAGDTIQLLNRPWKIAGVVEAGKLGRLFVPLDTLQDLTGNTGKLSQVLVKLDDPARTDETVAKLKEQLPNYPIYSIAELTSLFTVNNVPGLNAFIYVIISLSIILGFVVVSLTMYAAVLERTREIGVLKALGASPLYIVNILLRETGLIAVAGWLAGILLAFGARWAIRTFVPASLTQQIVPDWWPIALAVALGAAVLGAIYPGLKAARQDAIEALSYE
ncbi:MAG: FtsX-like permease family protein [Bryobacteraceae bacterium]|nr:FtsX-like permease family protein [Bryobacteraceae bacterium]